MSAARKAGASAVAATRPGLLREVGRWGTVTLMFNSIVGAGIFGLPSSIHALAGSYGLLAFVACALVIAPIGLCFAEVASRFTHSGGSYLYTREAFGPAAGFLVGWLMLLTRVTSLAVVSNVMASYLSFFWSPAGSGWGRALVMTGAIGLLALINVIGVKRASDTLITLAAAKLVPLLLFVALGLAFIDPHRLAFGAAPATTAFSQAVFQLIFAFGGFEIAVIAAGEMRDPRRHVAFALLVSIGAATLLYVLIQVVCVGTLPGLAASTKPLADASLRFMGSAGAAFITAGALVSTIGTQGATLLAGPRLLFAMAEQGQMPRALETTHRRFHTPHRAILLTAAVGLALSITGTFTYLVGLNVIVRLACYAITAGALIALRRREADHPAVITVPGGSAIALVVIAVCGWLASRSGARELRDAGIALALGVAFYLLGLVRRRRSARRAT